MTDTNRQAVGGSALRGALVGATTALIVLGVAPIALAATQPGLEEAAAQLKGSISATTQPGLVESSQPVVKRGGTQAGLSEAIRRVEPPKELEPEPAPAPEPAPSAPQQAHIVPAPAPAPAPVWRAPTPVRQVPAPVQAAPAPAPAPVQPAPARIDISPNLPVVPQAPIPLNPIFG